MQRSLLIDSNANFALALCIRVTPTKHIPFLWYRCVRDNIPVVRCAEPVQVLGQGLLALPSESGSEWKT